jgi:Zinc knuckle
MAEPQINEIDGNLVLEGINIAGLIGLVKFYSSENGTTTIQEFLNSLQTASDLGQWSDPQKVCVLKARLVGPALRFFEADPEVNTAAWPDVKTKFLEWFGEATPSADPLHSFYQLCQKQNESAKNFIVRLKIAGKAAAPASLPEATRVARQAVVADSLLSVFVNNLREESGKEYLVNFPQPDLESTIQFCTRFENNLVKKKRVFPIRAENEQEGAMEGTRETPSLSRMENKLIATINHLEKSVKALNLAQQSIVNPRKTEQVAQVRTQDDQSRDRRQQYREFETPRAQYHVREQSQNRDTYRPRVQFSEREHYPIRESHVPRGRYPTREYLPIRERYPSREEHYSRVNSPRREIGPPIPRERARSQTRLEQRTHRETPKIYCYRCGMTGHFATRCNAPPREERRRLNCESCGRAGHSRRECGTTASPRGPATRATPQENFPSRST